MGRRMIEPDFRAKRQVGYDAVYSLIRQAGTDAETNGLIWQAVQAFADTYVPVAIARALENVRCELDSPDPTALVTVQAVRDALAFAKALDELQGHA